MKYFAVLALCVAAASAFTILPIITGENAAEIQQIIDAIYHPSTDPATAAALEEMLLQILGHPKPEPVIIPPGIVTEDSPISTLPAIIDPSIFIEPANYKAPPLVQIIVNVNSNAPGNPVEVEQPEEVSVVEKPEIKPEEVIVAPIMPEKPVIVAPIETVPVVTLPGILN